MSRNAQRHRVRLVTVAFVRNGDEVLLKQHAEHGDRFAGLWNGVGGHVEAGEDIRAAARRELREETGVDVSDLSLRGVIHETGLQGSAHVVFLFVGECAQRELQPEPGLRLAWQPLARLSELPLVADVAPLLPRLLTTREPVFVTEAFGAREDEPAIRVEGEALLRA